MYVVPFCIKLSLYMYVFIGLFICSLIYLSIFIYLLISSIQSIYKPLIFLVINSFIHIYLVRHQPICFYPSFYQSIHPFSIHLSMNTCTCMYIYIIIYIYLFIYIHIYVSIHRKSIIYNFNVGWNLMSPKEKGYTTTIIQF